MAAQVPEKKHEHAGRLDLGSQISESRVMGLFRPVLGQREMHALCRSRCQECDRHLHRRCPDEADGLRFRILKHGTDESQPPLDIPDQRIQLGVVPFRPG